MRPTYLTINTSLVRENLRKIKDSLPEWSTSTAVSRPMATATAAL